MRKRGRPLKFENIDILQSKIDEYFNVTKEEDWTITGLAIHLDTTRDTLMDYEGRDDFSDAIKKGKEKVHSAYEKDLRRKGRSGDIFALKNFGWTDKTEVEQTIKDEGTNLSPEALKVAKKYEEELKKLL